MIQHVSFAGLIATLLFAPTPRAQQQEQKAVAGIGGKFGGRQAGRRALGRMGGKPAAEAIAKGLEWLKAHQGEDGRWSATGFTRHCLPDRPCKGVARDASDVLVTGTALLALLADGSTMRSGSHKNPIKTATIWLKDQQRPGGRLGDGTSVHDHAVASLAMIECYGLSLYRTLRRHAQLCVDWLLKARNDDGGWGAEPGDSSSSLVPTAWAIMALKAAKDFGLRVNEDSFSDAAKWFDRITSESSGKYAASLDPGAVARPFESTPNARIAIGSWSRILLGQAPRTHAVLRASADQLLKRPPKWTEGRVDLGYWLHGSYFMFQMGGRHWNLWRKHLESSLIKTQRKDEHTGGSWDPTGVGAREGGRVYATALGVLTLQVYYRYSRLIR